MNVLTKLVDINSLTLLENNPRRITKEQFEKLCHSLEKDPKFFWNRPCLVHEKEGKLEVYAGNQRVLAAKKLKWKQVPCIIEDELDDEIKKDRIVKDNAHYGEFDFDILANEYDLETLLESGLETKDLVGFDQEIEDLGEMEEPTKEPEQEKKCPNCGWDLS